MRSWKSERIMPVRERQPRRLYQERCVGDFKASRRRGTEEQ